MSSLTYGDLAEMGSKMKAAALVIADSFERGKPVDLLGFGSTVPHLQTMWQKIERELQDVTARRICDCPEVVPGVRRIDSNGVTTLFR